MFSLGREGGRWGGSQTLTFQTIRILMVVMAVISYFEMVCQISLFPWLNKKAYLENEAVISDLCKEVARIMY